jgi:hypothetical protein
MICVGDELTFVFIKAIRMHLRLLLHRVNIGLVSGARHRNLVACTSFCDWGSSRRNVNPDSGHQVRFLLLKHLRQSGKNS